MLDEANRREDEEDFDMETAEALFEEGGEDDENGEEGENNVEDGEAGGENEESEDDDDAEQGDEQGDKNDDENESEEGAEAELDDDGDDNAAEVENPDCAKLLQLEESCTFGSVAAAGAASLSAGTFTEVSRANGGG